MNAQIRVLLIAQQLRRRVPGGIGTYIRGLIQGLDEVLRARQSPGVLSVSLHAGRVKARPDPLAALGFPVVTTPLPGPILTRAWDRRLLGVGRGYDVVQATSLSVPVPSGAKLVVTVHDLAWRKVPEAYPSRGRKWHEQALRRALDRAAEFVVPDRSVADDLCAAGAESERVHVIQYGADHLPDPDEQSAERLLASIGVQGQFLLSVGTLEPRKNLHGLIAAYDKARVDLPEPWPLVIVGPKGWGPGSRTEVVSKRVATMDRGHQGPHPGVLETGRIDDATLRALYRRARVVAYVPVTEGFGLPPVEAMREGTPVVSSPLPSTAGNSLEVDPLDSDEIAGALVRACVDEDLRSRLVASGTQRASVLTWSATAARHIALWESQL